MSGHSKWSTIKRKKAANDAKRANAFGRLLKEVTIAARDGADPEMNYKLRLAVDKAKAANVPNNNISRAIDRGAGKDGEEALEEIVYEAYGPGQVAMLIKVLTDNRNRTLMELKNIFKERGGKLAEAGSVSWQFEAVGVLEVELPEGTKEEAEELIIESGAKDYRLIGEKQALIFTLPKELAMTRDALMAKGFKITKETLSYLAKNTVELDEAAKIDYKDLLGDLDQNEDVVEITDNL